MAVDIPPPQKPAIIEAAQQDVRERISAVRISFARMREASNTNSEKNTQVAQSGFNQALPFQNFNQFTNFNDFSNFNDFHNFNDFTNFNNFNNR